MGRRRLLNGHIGITKSDHFGLTILTSANDRLLAAFDISARFIAWQIAGVHFLRFFILAHPLAPTRR
jgi:hypothetical protein